MYEVQATLDQRFIPRSRADEKAQYSSRDSLSCKISAVSLGYFEDPHVARVGLQVRTRFGLQDTHKRSPLMHRGYYARHDVFSRIIKNFIALTESSSRRQIIHLGCGFDTLSLLPYHAGYERCYTYEVDFDEVAYSKAEIFRSDATISGLLLRKGVSTRVLNESNSSTGSEKTSAAAMNNGFVQVGPITFIGQDLRDVRRLHSNLHNVEIGFDFNAPTLILSECVLVYVEKHYVDSLCNELQNILQGEVIWATYDMIEPNDVFGKKMKSNLEAMGFNIPGLLDYPDLEAQRERFLRTGWMEALAMSMKDYYTRCISSETKIRLQQLEMLDEVEEFNMLMAHYSLTTAHKSTSTIAPEGVSLYPLVTMFTAGTEDITATSTTESKTSSLHPSHVPGAS